MFKNKKQLKFLLASSLAVFILFTFGVLIASSALAIDPIGNEQSTQCTEEKKGIYLQVSIPGLGKISGTGLDYCVKGFPEYIKSIYNLFIGIVGFLAVIMIMAGGFQWLIAAGNAQKISGAKTTIISAIMGLVLALGSYSILSWVNPRLTVLKLELPEITKTGEATDTCNKKDTQKNYIKVDGQSFNQITDKQWDKNAVVGAETRCGDEYYIRKRGGDTCDGTFCEDAKSGYRCFNEVCVKGSWFGNIACGAEDNKCVDFIHIRALCVDKDTKKNYKLDTHLVGKVNIDERAVEYKIEKLESYKDLTGGDAGTVYCNDSKYKPAWLFMAIEAKSGGSDDWRGLGASGKDNIWVGSRALAGCYDIKPSEFSNEQLTEAVRNNQLMPLEILKEDNLPIFYDISIQNIEAFNPTCGHCHKCD